MNSRIRTPSLYSSQVLIMSLLTRYARTAANIFCNISRKTDQFIISNENTLEAKQNETQLEDLPMVTEFMEITETKK